MHDAVCVSCLPLQALLQEAGGGGYGLDRIVLPMSSLGGWAMIAAGVLTGLHVCGINIQPLLAVGGVSGIAIGFGAQTVTANAIAGVNLVIGFPFLSHVLTAHHACSHHIKCQLQMLFYDTIAEVGGCSAVSDTAVCGWRPN